MKNFEALPAYTQERIKVYNRHIMAINDIKGAIYTLTNDNKAVAELLESLLNHIEKARSAEFCLRQDCMTKEAFEELEPFVAKEVI